MPLYRFYLRDGADLLEDDCGTCFPDLPAAVGHAGNVARELLQHRERESRHCTIEVYGEDREPLMVVPFATVDPTLDHLDGDSRAKIEGFSALVAKVKATMTESKMTVLASRAIEARWQRRPYVAADRGITFKT